MLAVSDDEPQPAKTHPAQQDSTEKFYESAEDEEALPATVDDDVDDDKEEDFIEKREEGVVLMFTLRNFSQVKVQNFTIRFDQSQRDLVNYNMPVSDLRSRVGTTMDSILMKLTKLRPNEPWGTISFDMLVDDENFDGNNCKFNKNYPELRFLRTDVLDQIQN